MRSALLGLLETLLIVGFVVGVGLLYGSCAYVLAARAEIDCANTHDPILCEASRE